jgi:hypothetical protein
LDGGTIFFEPSPHPNAPEASDNFGGAPGPKSFAAARRSAN